MNRKNVRIIIFSVFCFILGGLFVFIVSSSCGEKGAEDLGGSIASAQSCLDGVAWGGKLVVYRAPLNVGTTWPSVEPLTYISVSTEEGESASSVLRRVMSLRKERAYGEWTAGAWPGTGCLRFSVMEAFTFGGTERGFGLPEPLTSLSGTYRRDHDGVRLRWAIRNQKYDRIGLPNSIKTVKGDRRGYDTPKGHFERQYTWAAIGYKGVREKEDRILFQGIPSPATAIYVRDNYQEELYAIPFAGGLAPNWLGWVHGGSREKNLKLCEGTRKRVLKALEGHTVKKPEEKPFYQIIRPKSAGVSGGIWRKFLGLTPGHKYRVSVILSTLKMDQAEGDWAFSFHAIPDGAEGKDLTPKQMAGKTPLPGGSSGPKAGRLVRYDADHTTEGKWIKSTTAPDDRSPGREIGDITLPEGVTSISLWARHSGENSTGVGYLWVKLEDLSMELPEETE